VPCSIRHLILMFLAAAMPLCCCQVGALARAFNSTAQVGGSCCRVSCCEAESQTSEVAQSGCCDGENSSAPHRDCGGECCKRVATNLAGPAWTDVHMIAAECQLASTVALGSASTSVDSISAQWETGPPPRPSGRESLTLYAVLVI